MRIKRIYLKNVFLYIFSFFSKKKAILCVSVDCDGHEYNERIFSKIERNFAFDKGYSLLFKIYDFLGFRGKITWFINNRYDFSDKYFWVIRDLLARNECVGLHLHADELIQRESEDLKNIFEDQHANLSNILSKAGSKKKINCFRAGNLVRSRLLFRLLTDAKISIDSSLSHNLLIERGGFTYDDSIIPSNIYYLDKENEKLANVQREKIVEIPISQPLPGKIFANFFNEPLVHTIFIHPYNLIKVNGAPNLPRLFIYIFFLLLLKIRKNTTFSTLEKAVDIWEKKIDERKKKIELISQSKPEQIMSIHERRFSELDFSEIKNILGSESMLAEWVNNGVLVKKGDRKYFLNKDFKKILYQLNEYHISSRNNLLNSIFKKKELIGKQILDLGGGCGGQLINSGARESALYILDIDNNALEVGVVLMENKEERNNKAHYILGSSVRTAFENKFFDIILSRNSLPYMEVKKTLHEMLRILKQNGHIILKYHSVRHYRYHLERALTEKRIKYIVYYMLVILNGRLLERTGVQIKVKFLKRVFMETYISRRTLKSFCQNSGCELEIFNGDARTPTVIITKNI